MWNGLVNWYRDWEQEQLRVLEHPELAATLAPGFRRCCGLKMAELSPIERQQLHAFSLKYRGWRIYAAIARLLLLFTLAGVALFLIFPGRGLVNAIMLANVFGLGAVMACFIVWFNYRKMTGRAVQIALKLLGWSVFVVLVNVVARAVWAGASWQEALARQGPAELATCLGVVALFALPMAVVGLLRNQQYQTLTAKLELDTERERAARELSESRLRLLRAQIEPHFLFNTLGAVQQLAEKGAPLAAGLTASLIEFLRASLAQTVDYLLKPVQADRLARALARLDEKLARPPADLSGLLRQLKAALPPAPERRLKWIKATVGKQIRLIDVDDVLFLQSDTKYTRVVLAGSEALVKTPLKDLLGGLDPQRFWQIHRGTVINLKAIAGVERLDAERLEVSVRGCVERLAVSRSFAHLFRD